MSQTLDADALEQLVTAVVQAVMAQLAPRVEPPPDRVRTIPVLVCDTRAGIDFAVAALNAFRHPHYRLDYLLLDSGDPRLARERLAAMAPHATCRPVAEAGCPLRLARACPVVVAATLDRVTAVRTAQTLPDGFGAKLLLEALCLGKPVVLATDGLGIDRPEAAPLLRQALYEPLGALEGFGATCVAATDLGQALELALAAPAGAPPVQRALLTAADVEAADGELLVEPGALITPLALDRARELGVKLHRLPG